MRHSAIVFGIVTLAWWMPIPAVMCLMLLCLFPDGIADAIRAVMGRDKIVEVDRSKQVAGDTAPAPSPSTQLECGANHKRRRK